MIAGPLSPGSIVHWAVYAKRPGDAIGYGITEASVGRFDPTEYLDWARDLLPGDPGESIAPGSGLPWVILTPLNVRSERFYAIVIVERTDDVDHSDREI